MPKKSRVQRKQGRRQQAEKWEQLSEQQLSQVAAGEGAVSGPHVRHEIEPPRAPESERAPLTPRRAPPPPPPHLQRPDRVTSPPPSLHMPELPHENAAEFAIRHEQAPRTAPRSGEHPGVEHPRVEHPQTHFVEPTISEHLSGAATALSDFRRRLANGEIKPKDIPAERERLITHLRLVMTHSSPEARAARTDLVNGLKDLTALARTNAAAEGRPAQAARDAQAPVLGRTGTDAVAPREAFGTPAEAVAARSAELLTVNKQIAESEKELRKYDRPGQTVANLELYQTLVEQHASLVERRDQLLHAQERERDDALWRSAEPAAERRTETSRRATSSRARAVADDRALRADLDTADGAIDDARTSLSHGNAAEGRRSIKRLEELQTRIAQQVPRDVLTLRERAAQEAVLLEQEIAAKEAAIRQLDVQATRRSADGGSGGGGDNQRGRLATMRAELDGLKARQAQARVRDEVQERAARLESAIEQLLQTLRAKFLRTF